MQECMLGRSSTMRFRPAPLRTLPPGTESEEFPDGSTLEVLSLYFRCDKLDLL
jgi:hypothetical protein